MGHVCLDSFDRFLCSGSRIVADNVIDFLIKFLGCTVFNCADVFVSQMVGYQPVHLFHYPPSFIETLQCVVMLNVPGVAYLAELRFVLNCAKDLRGH